MLKRKNRRQSDRAEEPRPEDFVSEQQTGEFPDPPDAVQADTPQSDTGGRDRPPRIKTRKAVSQESAPVAFDRQPHARTEAQSSARPPQIKTKEAVRESRCVVRKDTGKFENYPADKPAEQRSLKAFQDRTPESTIPRESLPDEPAVHPRNRAATHP